MPQELTATEAAALVNPTDSLASGLGPAWPPVLMKALGERDDWVTLQLDGAHVTVETELLTRTGVHYRCGFFGPRERAARAAGGDIEFMPSDFRRFGPLLSRVKPRVMVVVVAPPDEEGFCSLSLHAGATIDEMKSAAADPDRLLIAEAATGFPRTYGLPPAHRHALHLDEIDVLIHSDGAPAELTKKPITEVDQAIAARAVELIMDGSTLQAGIGSVPEAITELLAQGDGGDYGIHSELFSDGMMALHEAGKVTNQKGLNDGKSVTTFTLGSKKLYDWLHENDKVAYLPVQLVNDPHIVDQNRKMVTINGALAIDLYGQVVADTRFGKQFSGVGGAEDFVSGPEYAKGGRSLMCIHSTANVGGAPISRIVPSFPAGTVVTTPRHHLDYVITEHGAVDVAAMTVKQRALALAELAHPDFREQLKSAAENIST